MSGAIEIKRGTFKLARDVENPKPNRRHTRQWTAQGTWTKGMYFVVDDYPIGRGESIAHVRRPHSSEGFTVNDPRFWTIVSHLEPVEEKPSDVLARVGYEHLASTVMDRLFDAGKITIVDVEAALTRELASDEEAS